MTCLTMGQDFRASSTAGNEFDFGAAAIGAVLGDDGGGLRVVNAVDERVGGESAEDDGVRRADAGAGEQGDGQVRASCPCRWRRGRLF